MSSWPLHISSPRVLPDLPPPGMKPSSLSMSQDFPRRMASPYRPPPRGDFHSLARFSFNSVSQFCGHSSRLIHVFSIQLRQSPIRTIVPDLNAARSPAIDTGTHEADHLHTMREKQFLCFFTCFMLFLLLHYIVCIHSCIFLSLSYLNMWYVWSFKIKDTESTWVFCCFVTTHVASKI